MAAAQLIRASNWCLIPANLFSQWATAMIRMVTKVQFCQSMQQVLVIDTGVSRPAPILALLSDVSGIGNRDSGGQGGAKLN